MILLMQTNTILNCLHTTSEVCEMCIKIFYVAQAITSLYKKVKEYSQIKATLNVEEDTHQELNKITFLRE